MPFELQVEGYEGRWKRVLPPLLSPLALFYHHLQPLQLWLSTALCYGPLGILECQKLKES